MSAADRSSRRDVRNPLLALPAARKIADSDAPWRADLRALLLELQADARARAEESWRRHKAPMAVYWKAVAVYAGHLARILAPARAPAAELKRAA
jgi:hypothetical protein